LRRLAVPDDVSPFDVAAGATNNYSCPHGEIHAAMRLHAVAAIAVIRFGVNEERSIAAYILVSRRYAKMPKLRRGQIVLELP
jgi:hypothetical protein